MDLNICNQTKNVDDGLALNQILNNGSIESMTSCEELNFPDNPSTNNITTSDLGSNSSCESNLSEDIDGLQIASVEKTKICVPLSIETKDTNAFLLTSTKEFKAPKYQTESLAYRESDNIENIKKKNLRNRRKEGKINTGTEKESKHNKKSVLCCFSQTETVEENTNSIENKVPELRTTLESKSHTNIEEHEQKTQEKITGNISNNNIDIIHQNPIIDKTPRPVESNHNDVNCKSTISKSLDDIYKIFEHRMNIEIPKFDNSMDLSFLSKRFGNKGMGLKDPSPINFTSFNDKAVSEIISDTLSWYEMQKLSKLKKLKCVINE